MKDDLHKRGYDLGDGGFVAIYSRVELSNEEADKLLAGVDMDGGEPISVGEILKRQGPMPADGRVAMALPLPGGIVLMGWPPNGVLAKTAGG
jgi:hypothetical protein